MPKPCSRRRDRLCENSEMAFWKNEKRVLGPLAAKENAPYRNCGGRFSRVAGWRGVFAQSVTSAATGLRQFISRACAEAPLGAAWACRRFGHRHMPLLTELENSRAHWL